MKRAREYNETHKIKKEVHFGSIKALCHIKNFKRAQVEWQYKGRIVFRGDLVKDETGYKVVFDGTLEKFDGSLQRGTLYAVVNCVVGRRYSVQVIARNSLGWGIPSLSSFLLQYEQKRIV